MCLLRPCGCDVHKSANCMICPCASWAPPCSGACAGKATGFPPHRTTMTQTKCWSIFQFGCGCLSALGRHRCPPGDWPPTAELVRFCVSSLEKLTRTMTSDLLVRLGSCVHACCQYSEATLSCCRRDAFARRVRHDDPVVGVRWWHCACRSS